LNKYGERKIIYRRVLPHEEDRGELYPVLTSGYNTFADFGIGMGIYFTQLLVLAFVSLLAGSILIIGSYEYTKDDYGIDKTDLFLYITAACPSFQNITATVGCSEGPSANCTINYLPNCEIPQNVIYADLIMSLLFAVTIFATKLLENSIQEKLDIALQTISDYSIEVLDPEIDADNPDEWYEFFSRFGSVRYISVIRRNDEIIYSTFKKHLIIKKIEFLKSLLELQSTDNKLNNDPNAISSSTSCWSKLRCCFFQRKKLTEEEEKEKILLKIDKLTKRLTSINEELAKEYLKSYKVCRIYVTYEHEEHQRLALQSLEVPDFNAIFDIKDLSNAKTLFRTNNVLNVIEPVEPNNVNWENLSYDYSYKKLVRYFLSFAFSAGALIAVWYVIVNARDGNKAFQLGAVIAIFDSLLPFLFEMFTDILLPTSESMKQSDLQLRLFGARLLLSTVVPYFSTSWNGILDRDFIQQVIVIQISACFIAPLMAYFDIGNALKRNLFAFYQSDTQEELNLKWSASEWTLAEKYTGISKVLFVSLYYAILVPYSILLAMCAFLLMFFIDRYLLLRKWKIGPMFDECIAVRLRQQAILAVAAHMYVTIRFIYSWPMDQTYIHHQTGEVEKVDKYPSWNVFRLTISQEWQSQIQKDALVYYYIGMILVFMLVLYVWIIVPFGSTMYRLFCYNLKVIGDTQGISFSSLTNNITVYEPVYPYRETHFLCSYLINVQQQHRPTFITAYDDENHDISSYIPPIHKPHVLSIVKYYSKEYEESYHRNNHNHSDTIAGDNKMVRAMTPSSSSKKGRGGRDVDLEMIELGKDSEDENSDEEDEEEKKENPKRSHVSAAKPTTSKGRKQPFSRNRFQSGNGNDDRYHPLPLHLEIEQRINPHDSYHMNNKKGSLPEELKQKIASKMVGPSSSSVTSPADDRRGGGNFTRSSLRRSMERDRENRNNNRFSRNLSSDGRRQRELVNLSEDEEDDIEKRVRWNSQNQNRRTGSANSQSFISPPNYSRSPPKENYRKK
jgi:hypothetical protein